jgi:hypothetical protein
MGQHHREHHRLFTRNGWLAGIGRSGGDEATTFPNLEEIPRGRNSRTHQMKLQICDVCGTKINAICCLVLPVKTCKEVPKSKTDQKVSRLVRARPVLLCPFRGVVPYRAASETMIFQDMV